MSTPKIGFIGLGLMGGAMVSRLQDRGYALTVMGNRDRTELDKAIGRGAAEATSARELAAASDITMLCVGTSEQVEGRMRGPDGVMSWRARLRRLAAPILMPQSGARRPMPLRAS